VYSYVHERDSISRSLYRIIDVKTLSLKKEKLFKERERKRERERERKKK